jgi:hypothetical protein
MERVEHITFFVNDFTQLNQDCCSAQSDLLIALKAYSAADEAWNEAFKIPKPDPQIIQKHFEAFDAASQQLMSVMGALNVDSIKYK